MPFLQWLGKLALGMLFSKLGEWSVALVAWIKEKIDRSKRKTQIEEESKASVEPLKKAVTGEEIDAAARDALDKL